MCKKSSWSTNQIRVFQDVCYAPLYKFHLSKHIWDYVAFLQKRDQACTVAQLLSKITELIAAQPTMETDLKELKNHLKKLTDSTFLIRKDYEQDIIHFHLAQKRLVRIL